MVKVVNCSLAAAAILLVAPATVAAQTPHPDAGGDVSAGYSIMRDSASKTFNGFRVSGAKNLSKSWAIVVEVGRDANGGSTDLLPPGAHAVTYADKTFLAGLRLRRFDGSSTAPFFQALAGYFGRSNSATSTTTTNSFAVRLEGGLDVLMKTQFAFRFGGGWTFLNGGVRYLNQIGANAGVACLFGKR